MERKIATVFGGSGFLGRQLVAKLAKDGYIVRIAGRDTEKSAGLRHLGEVGQIIPVLADVTHPQSLALAVAGADVVYNLVGILYESGKSSFDKIHAEGAGNVAKAASDAGCRKLVHVSAMGVSLDHASAYAQSKAKGEELVRAAFPKATIFRPSVIFGADDGFFNRFAALAMYLKFLPVYTGDGLRPDLKNCNFDFFGSGGPKFQPVYVEDVVAALTSRGTCGKTYELGGPNQYSMLQIMEMIRKYTARNVLIAPLPYWLGDIQAFFLGMLPKPIMTRDHMKLLRKDNVVSGELPGLKDLGIMPTPAEAVVPYYLAHYRPAGQQALVA